MPQSSRRLQYILADGLVERPPWVYTRTAVSRIALVAAAASLILFTACGSGDGRAPPATVSPNSTGDSLLVLVTPGPRPPTVSQTAEPIVQTTALGRIDRRANEPPQAVMTRRLEDATCRDDVLVIETSEETIYAPLPCDRFWDPDTVEAFSDEEVAIVLEVTVARYRVLIETLELAQAEFTVGGIWVD